MVKLTLFVGTNCPNCPKAKKVLSKVVDELDWEEGKDYEIKNIDDDDNMVEALTYQIASTPSIVIDGEAVFRGSTQIPTKEELIEALK